MGGQIYLTHYDALRALAPEITAATLTQPRCETAK
jgi:SulP family sulfate permease